MKICIVTVYNSENCGSFWQAFVLQEYLKSLGFEVYFLKRNMKGASHTPVDAFIRMILALKEGGLKHAYGIIKQYRIYNNVTSVFRICEQCDEQFDVCVLGSDTIWNLDRPYFVKEIENYWGKTSRAKKTISYAASVSNTDLDTIKKYPDAISSLNNLDLIGVRDNHTLSVLKKYTDNEINIVCDPTMLYDKHFYEEYCRQARKEKYIFIYYFNKVPSDLEQKVRKFARKNNLKIVVMGNSMSGDEHIYEFSPFEFIKCFLYADFILTNTYHGTIFTIIFEKSAVFNSCGKKKILDMLEKYNLKERDYSSEGFDEFSFRLDNIDYSDIRKIVYAEREYSRSFLGKAVLGK